MCVRHSLVAILILATTLAVTGPVIAELKSYETEHYTIHTDLDEEGVREAKLRVDTLFEAYLQHTPQFTGHIAEKYPIVIFTNKAEYKKATGVPESSGLYTGSALFVLSEKRTNERTWRILQHEAFHQFVHRRIGGGVPTWANEGLAEYFGHAVFTGGGYVVGVIDEDAMKDVQYKLRGNRYKPIEELLSIGGYGWYKDMDIKSKARRNYRQAWSFVYFIMHYDNGRYRAPFIKVLQQAGAGRAWSKAWAEHFPIPIDELERQWREYWLDMTVEDTRAGNIEAMTSTFINYLALAARHGQRFSSAREFFSKAQARKIETSDDDWLPPDVAKNRVAEATRLGRWKLKMTRREVELSCKGRGGERVRGTFQIDDGRTANLKVAVEGSRDSRRTKRARP